MKFIYSLIFLFIFIINGNTADIWYVSEDAHSSIWIEIDGVDTKVENIIVGDDAGNSGLSPDSVFQTVTQAISSASDYDTIVVFRHILDSDSYGSASTLSINKAVSIQSNFARLNITEGYFITDTNISSS